MTGPPSPVVAFPMSPGQERLWFLHQMAPEIGAAYTVAVRLDISGPVCGEAFQEALNTVVARHEALRTALASQPAGLRQVVHSAAAATLRVYDMSAQPEEEAEARIDALARAETRRPWQLERVPLVRALLVRGSPERHVLVLAVHHAVCDGLSLHLLLGELLDAYAQHRAGGPVDLGPEPLQFGDYTVWNRDRAGGAPAAQRREAAERYWRDTLLGAPLVLELPGNGQRPTVQEFAGGRVPVRIPAELVDGVGGLAARTATTPGSVLLAAFQIALARLSGSDDTLIGVPVANRARAELRDVVGYFANTGVVRADLRGDPSGAEVVRRAHTAVRAATRYADQPFSALVEVLDPPRLSDRNPVFQVMFGFQQDVERSLKADGLDVRVGDVDNGTSRVDLSLFLFADRGGAVDGFVEYAAVVGERQAQRFGELLLRTLRALVEDAHAPASALATSADTAYGFGGGEPAPAESSENVADRVRARARARPRAVAVRSGGSSLDYARLDERADAVARGLRAAGTEHGDRVAVHAVRGADTAVLILGIWRAGAVYVPLDPYAPPQRNAHALRGAAPRLLIEGDGAPYPADPPGQPLRSTVQTLERSGRAAAPPRPPRAEDAAYCMFTSGSTGVPKGVVITHGNLSYFLAAVTRTLGIDEKDTVLAMTTPSFDISLLELLAPLWVGARAEVAAADTQRDPAELVRALSDPEVTLAQATPSTWKLALDAGWRPDGTKRLVSGGEALPRDLADELASAGDTLWNLYGPTETTVWSCASRVTPGEPVTVGTPLPGTTAVVVDTRMRPVGEGVCGELLLGGPGVSAGYLADPAATAARFLPDPGTPGSRLYRTGDIVRRCDDGAIQFVGRNDDQVKVRGHRVELGDVEQALRGAPGVRDAIAAPLPGQEGAGLAAYLVLDGDHGDGAAVASAVREHMSATVPPAAAPGELYRIAAVPVNANGKTDRSRAALGAVRLGGAARRGARPATGVERRLAGIWCELLDVPDVAMGDDFFALGGHSLLLARLVLRVEEETGVRVPVAEVFMEPTLARLAATVQQASGHPAGPEDEASGAEDPDPGWDFEPVIRSGRV